jgi:hypothetical protein
MKNIVDLGALSTIAHLLVAGCTGAGGSGEFECRGTECVCPSSGDCVIDCLDACDLQCAGSGACDFVCDDGCLVSCTGSGPCISSVGHASTVSCPGAGGCDVDCNGDCTLDCPGSGTCIARCEPGFACAIERCGAGTTTCPTGELVCNGACPP